VAIVRYRDRFHHESTHPRSWSPRSLVDVMLSSALQSPNIRNLSHWMQIAWMDGKGAPYPRLQEPSSCFAVVSQWLILKNVYGGPTPSLSQMYKSIVTGV